MPTLGHADGGRQAPSAVSDGIFGPTLMRQVLP
jgi:hypothetical protein